MAEQEDQELEALDEAAEERGPDYKALYEQERKHSRAWERRAKENADAKARADALEAEKERRQWVADVSRETGVPADVVAQLAADSADDLRARAKAVAGHFKRDALPVVPGDGARPEVAPADDMRSFVRQLMGREAQ